MSIEAPLGAAADRSLIAFRGSSLREPQRSVRAARRAWHEPAAVTAVPVLGLLLCVAATRTDILAPESVRPFPGLMAGPLDLIGLSLNTGELASVVLLMLLSYVLAVRCAERVSARTVIGAVVVLNVAVLLAPPMFSTDVFSYQAYARMFAIYHTNPYTHGPEAIGLDPIYYYIGAKWVSTPSVYGPLFTLISAPLAWVSVLVSELTFKFVAAACSAGTLLLIWKASRLRGVNPLRGIALYGLNPMIMVYGVGGGHNDFLMVVLMMSGVYATLLQRSGRSGVMIMTGTAIKLTGGIVLPFAVLANRELAASREPGGCRASRRFLIGAGAVVLVVAGASAAAFGLGVTDTLGTLRTVQDLGAWQSVPGFLFSVAHLQVTGVVRTLMNVLLASIFAWLIWRVWSHKLDWLDGAAWATLAVLATAWAMLPWYIVWLMPLVALSRSRHLWTSAILISLIAGAMMLADCFPRGIPLFSWI